MLFLTTSPVRASLYLSSDPIFGPNSVTVDTSTGLGWLNLSFTTDLSYNQVIAETQPGGIFAGFSFATVQQVDGLYASAGIPATGNYPQATPAIAYLFSLIGTTGLYNGYPGFIARSGTSFGAGNTAGNYAPAIYLFHADSVLTYTVSVTQQGSAPGNAAPDLGNWLVEEVPEPVSAQLFILVAASWSGFRFSQRRNGAG